MCVSLYVHSSIYADVVCLCSELTGALLQQNCFSVQRTISSKVSRLLERKGRDCELGSDGVTIYFEVPTQKESLFESIEWNEPPPLPMSLQM